MQPNYAAHPNYKQQQQQQPPPQPIYTQHPKHPQTHNQHQHQPIYQSQAQFQQQQPPLPSGATQRIYQQNPYGTTMRRAPPSAAAHGHNGQPAPPNGNGVHPAAAGANGQPRSLPVDSPSIPSSNAIDGAMYERDKQIYRCSTMRPSTNGGAGTGRYENGKSTFGGGGMKPSILNCPLPAIPTEASGGETTGTPTAAAATPTATVYDRTKGDKSHYSMSR